ncbi:MAG: hypothetical protein EOM41_06315 [Bacilli bacterium]|jgi:hypothetical protein|nr:hypothetical protein [Bacilli bacterium]
MRCNIELHDSVQSALDAILQDANATEIIYAQNVTSGEDLVEQSSDDKDAIHKFVDMEVECPPKDEAECYEYRHELFVDLLATFARQGHYFDQFIITCTKDPETLHCTYHILITLYDGAGCVVNMDSVGKHLGNAWFEVAEYYGLSGRAKIICPFMSNLPDIENPMFKEGGMPYRLTNIYEDKLLKEFRKPILRELMKRLATF